jgi:hypothetical protein
MASKICDIARKFKKRICDSASGLMTSHVNVILRARYLQIPKFFNLVPLGRFPKVRLNPKLALAGDDTADVVRQHLPQHLIDHRGI